MRSTFRNLALALLLVTQTVVAAAESFTGKVVGVIDGDTIDVLRDSRSVRIRLAEIDAPEKRQAFGQRSKQHLSDAIYLQLVSVSPRSTDRYGRTVGEVSMHGQSVNRMMVNDGYAWIYRRYSRSADMLAAEQHARTNSLGLWTDPNPVPPWEFRAQRKH